MSATIIAKKLKTHGLISEILQLSNQCINQVYELMGKEDANDINLTKSSLIHLSKVPFEPLKAFVLMRNPVHQQIRKLIDKGTVCDALVDKDKDNIISLAFNSRMMPNYGECSTTKELTAALAAELEIPPEEVLVAQPNYTTIKSCEI